MKRYRKTSFILNDTCHVTGHCCGSLNNMRVQLYVA